MFGLGFGFRPTLTDCKVRVRVKARVLTSYSLVTSTAVPAITLLQLHQMTNCYQYHIYPEVGKVQFEAQSATSATSAIAQVVLHFNFLF